ncbi:MAG: LysR family transcriptional regulator [Clostridiales bacterium]|nr:LysR family transcriptional regulator [Clostridiales bacterium]
MTLTQLRIFMAAAEGGTFSKAAEQLYITPPGILKQINALEGELGFALFHRSKKGISLTEYGRRIYDCCRPFVHNLDKALQQIQEQMARRDNTLYVGRTEMLAPQIVDFALETYQAENPEQEIIQQMAPLDKLYSLLEQGSLDMIFAPEDGVNLHPQLDYRILLSSSYELLLSADHPMADLSPEEIIAEYRGALIVIDNGHDGLNGQLIASMPDFFRTHEEIPVSSTEALLYNISKNVGIGVADQLLNINPFYNIVRKKLPLTHNLVLAYRKNETREAVNELILHLFRSSRRNLSDPQ